MDVIGQNPRLQSPFIYLQAAGSDGADHTAKGIHLRWALQRFLGNRHLPKGDYAAPGQPYEAHIGFSRRDDFVRISRAPYDPAFVRIDVKLESPDAKTETGPMRTWRYNGFQPIHEDPAITTDVEVRFADVALYDSVKASNPGSAGEFFRRYDGTLEVRALGKHLLSVCVELEPFKIDPDYNGPIAWGEAVATRTRTAPSDLYVSCRGEVMLESQHPQLCFRCEDVDHIRFRYKNGFLVVLHLQTYEDYIRGVFLSERVDWELVGAFALTLEDGIAEGALRNSPHDDVDGRWPKFNEDDPASGAFVVRAANYVDRWNNGLHQAVDRYLDLSRFDVLATEVVTDPTTQPEEASIEVSYLDSLNVVAQDFHVARMLGLGTIDRIKSGAFVYLMAYVTEAPLGKFLPPQFVTHYYLTPPVTLEDYRLPPPPRLLAPLYGLWHQPIENEPPHLLTDANGYTRFEPSRWINLERETFEFDQALPPFFAGAGKDCLCRSTLPAMYGIEYRRQGEPDWRRPEISHDSAYVDGAGLFESMGALELGENPIFTHRETEEGVHEYAAYSINWFSRVSALSNTIATDDTIFPVLRALKPPSNFAVQLVQHENPLIFTTAAEQAMLAALSGPDRTLVRVTYEWDQTHNETYQFSDRVELFFRDALPESILGQIPDAAAAITDAGNHRLRIRTEPQIVASDNPPIVRQPFLLPAQEARYSGSNFVAGGRPYVIDDIEFPNPSGNNPTFVIRQIRETTSLEGLEGESITQESWAGPALAGEPLPFMAVENLAPVANWDARLARTVYLEPFHEVWQVRVTGSANNDRVYTLAEVALAGGQTRVTVRENIPSFTAPLGALVFRRRARIVQASAGTSQIRVDGNLTAAPGGLAIGNAVRIFGSAQNGGNYTATNVTFAAGQTVITVAPALTSSVTAGYIDYEKRLSITSVDQANRRFTVAGDHTAELRPPRIETIVGADGAIITRVTGGMTGNATITEIPDGASPRSGAFEIVFDSLTLPDHVDPSIEWYRGTVRVLENAALFAPGSRPAERKILNVWRIDRSGTTLKLIAFDPSFDPSFNPANAPFNPDAQYVPIATGANVDVNVHPGYRLYLTSEAGFTESVILPATGEGNRKTLLAARSADTAIANTFSPLTPPAILLAQELRDPVPPGVPAGPLFATRPDVYGKATYTFDVDVSSPFALIFYRGTDRGILDALYRRDTVDRILADLAALRSPDAEFLNSRWRDLAGGVTDAAHRFPEYMPGGYRFPVPDNDRYVLPETGTRPFEHGTLPGLIIDAVRRAIEGSFVPLTEQPLIHAYLKVGTITSARPPVTRDVSGKMLLPTDPAFDPWPMAVRLPGGGVRFTDFTLDGASVNRFFYFGVELSNRMIRSERGPIAGPITLVNSSPPTAPAIRDVIVRRVNPVLGQRAAVAFTLNPYLEADRVVAFRIYRATDASAAASVRSMVLAGTVDAGEELLDDFEGLDLPPFGDPLFYRIVAMRRFLNESGEEELAPSFPSDVREVRLIDDVVPPAPSLAYSYTPPPPGPTVSLTDVTLSWSRTAWNPSYHVFKLNARGNWEKVHTLADNAETVSLDLADTTLGTNTLPKKLADGRTVYHRFKVVTENSSGLLSNEERALVI